MLEKLEFMLALARERHFKRAADSCGVAQPTLSLGIQALEEMLNVPLVKRTSRFQGFTPEGERVLVWARRMVGDAHAMRQEIFGLQRGVGSHIRIAALPSAIPIVATLTVPFQARYPDARFTVLARPSDVVMHLLHHRDADAGVTYIDNEPVDEATKIPLFRERYFMLATADNPLARRDRVGWATVGTLPLCLLTRDLQHRRIIDGVLRSVNIEPAPMIETDSSVALASHVATGRWVSIVPRSMMESIDLNGRLRAIPIVEPEVSRTIGLVVSERFAIQPTIAALMEQARAICPPELTAVA
jgi:DNA-binding transcriptional LysR family regulator